MTISITAEQLARTQSANVRNKPRFKLSMTAALLLAAFNACADETIFDLASLGGNSTQSSFVSANGSVVAGTFDTVGGYLTAHAFKYTDQGGMVDLGTLGGRYSSARAISTDGSTVVGISMETNGYSHAFKYTDTGGMIDLGTLGGWESWANAVSANGSVVVGASMIMGRPQHAFKYTDSGGMVDLGTLGGSTTDSSNANAVSADGSTVIGDSSVNAFTHGFKHTDSGGMVDLGTLGGNSSTAKAVSANGAVVAGDAALQNNEMHAFKHTDSGGMVDLGTLGGDYSSTSAISADGSTVVGKSNVATNGFTHAFKYTDSGGMVDLGTLGGRFTYANAVSADGAVVVGDAMLQNNAIHAFKYTDQGGIVDLGTLGGNNSSATGVSADGTVIVGQAGTANGEMHAVLWKNNQIVDSTNTRVALAQTAQQASQVIDMRSAQLQMLMQQDCNVLTGDGRFCIGAGAVYSGSSNARDTAASFTLGYQITPQWRIGTTINQSLDNTLPSEYKSSNNLPGIGVFSTFNARKDGLGWQARVAAAYQKSKLDINRKQLSYTEGGIGRADLDGKAAAVEGSYRMRTHNDVIVAPYAALRYSSVRRSAYNESNDVAFVGRYGEMGRSATSIEAGLRVGKTINSKLNLSADIGVTRDIAVNNQGFNVAMDYVGGFALGNGDDERTRAHLGVQGSYALAKDSAIQGGIYWAQQAYGNDSSSAQLRLIRQF